VRGVQGWFGEEHCVDIRVVAPALRWTAASELGGVGDGGTFNVTRSAFVPCVSTFLLEAEDTSVGVNGSNVTVESPYSVVIEPVGDVPSRVTFVDDGRGRVTRMRLNYAPARGDEGRSDTVCFRARDALGVAVLPTSCVTLRVKRCAYCIGEGDTLQSVTRKLAMDFNWMRLWLANGNEDGDPETTTIEHPDVLMDKAGTYVINVGSIYHVEKGDTLHLLAKTYQTTIRDLLSVNPDLEYAGHDAETMLLQVGHEMCIMPCTVPIPKLPQEVMDRLALPSEEL